MVQMGSQVDWPLPIFSVRAALLPWSCSGLSGLLRPWILRTLSPNTGSLHMLFLLPAYLQRDLKDLLFNLHTQHPDMPTCCFQTPCIGNSSMHFLNLINYGNFQDGYIFLPLKGVRWENVMRSSKVRSIPNAIAFVNKNKNSSVKSEAFWLIVN